MLIERLTLPALDLPLEARLHRPDGPGPAPLVILAHGFKGFMDWGPWPWLGARLAEQGIAMLRFNFSHNGIGPEPEQFTEFDRFQANTFTREVAEMGAALQAGARLILVPDGDHTFGARHPFQAEPPEPLRTALAGTLELLRSIR